MTAQPIAVLAADELQRLVREAVEAALVAASRKQAGAIERISAADAARMVGRRRSLVLAACASGALPAARSGRAWHIRASDLDAWAERGFPS